MAKSYGGAMKPYSPATWTTNHPPKPMPKVAQRQGGKKGAVGSGMANGTHCKTIGCK